MGRSGARANPRKSTLLILSHFLMVGNAYSHGVVFCPPPKATDGTHLHENRMIIKKLLLKLINGCLHVNDIEPVLRGNFSELLTQLTQTFLA